MKKVRLIALVLAFAMILCLSVVAAEPAVVEGEKVTATLQMAGTTAEFKENGEMISVTVTSASLEAGKQYLVLMVKSADGENYTIDSNSILYIDQKAATASGAEGTVTFDVYPSSMTDGVILIAGADDGLLKVAIIKGKYILGDVNGDKIIDLKDLTRLARYMASDPEATVSSMDAIDINGDGKQDLKDLVRLARHIADGTAMGKEN